MLIIKRNEQEENALKDRVLSRGMGREKSGEREGRLKRQTE